MTRSFLAALLCLALHWSAIEPARAQGWMHPDVAAAHASGYQGQDVAVIVVDTFDSDPAWTKLDYWGFATHGEIMERVVRDVAPKALLYSIDRNTYYAPITFLGPRLKIVNLSLNVMRPSFSNLVVAPQLSSIVYAAHNGLTVTVEGSGNFNAPLGGKAKNGKVDVLSYLLKSSPSVIFVGALEHNGSPGNKTQRSAYSNYAGSDPVYQSRMLFVGVDKDKIIYAQGTSAAAAIVSGYAAVVGSKFKNASPIQVTNQLLKTARQDTIAHYNPAIYGRGEASLSRALAPASLK